MFCRKVRDIYPPPRNVSEPVKVFAYAYTNQETVGERVDGMPWGCVAHAIGVLDGIMLYIYAR